MNKHKGFAIKIIGTLVVAFVFSRALSNSVFYASTPRINQEAIVRSFNSSKMFIASIFNRQNSAQVNIAALQKLPDNALKSIAIGVYAKENDQGNPIYIRVTKDVQWQDQTITYNGQPVTVSFPKDSTPSK